MVSDDHEGIKAAVAGELPGTEWQRCVVHFERNVLSSVPASAISEVAEDLKAIFKVRRQKTARALAEEFVELYGGRFAKAISVFEAGIDDALTYLRYPGSHHARIRTTNMVERLFKEVKWRTRVVGVFPNEVSASTLATEIRKRARQDSDLRPALTCCYCCHTAATWLPRVRVGNRPGCSVKVAGEQPHIRVFLFCGCSRFQCSSSVRQEGLLTTDTRLLEIMLVGAAVA